MVKLPIVALAVPVAVVILGLGVWSYAQNTPQHSIYQIIKSVKEGSFSKNTPQYSIYQIDKSVKDGDWATFQKYVDVDTTYTNAMVHVYQSFQDELAKTDCNQVSNLLNCLVLKSLVNQAPPNSPQTKAKVLASIQQQVECKCSYDNSFHVDNLASDMTQIKVDYRDGVASTTLFSDKYGSLGLKLKMQNGVWQVIDASPSAQAVQIFSGSK